MELVCLFSMLNGNSQEVVVGALCKKALNSNFLLMWELCLDEEMVPVWGQPVLQDDALLGNSPLAGEAGHSWKGGVPDGDSPSWNEHKCTNKVRELEIAEKGVRLREESLRTSTMLVAVACNIGCSAWSQTSILTYKMFFKKTSSLSLCTSYVYLMLTVTYSSWEQCKFWAA